MAPIEIIAASRSKEASTELIPHLMVIIPNTPDVNAPNRATIGRAASSLSACRYTMPTMTLASANRPTEAEMTRWMNSTHGWVASNGVRRPT